MLKMNLADALTLTRLFLVPFFVAAFAAGQKIPAFAIFAVAGFTDLIDGTVARWRGGSTKVGAILDPIADKLLAISCGVCLVSVSLIPLWFLLLIVVRDVMIMGGLCVLERLHVPMYYRAIVPSKIATFAMLCTALCALWLWLHPQSSLWGVSLVSVLQALILVTATLVVVSGILYLIMGIRALRSHFRRDRPC